jgi:metal-sulfur cluster biosynthetic enzyme
MSDMISSPADEVVLASEVEVRAQDAAVIRANEAAAASPFEPDADPSVAPEGRVSEVGEAAPGEPRPSDLVRDTLPEAPLPGAPAAQGAGAGASRLPEGYQPSIEDIEEALLDVVDPELGVNIVDLGMVEDIIIDERSNVTIELVPTSPTCPMTDRLEWSAQMATEGLVNTLTINWLWLEVWTPERLTDEGREQLRAFGLNI